MAVYSYGPRMMDPTGPHILMANIVMAPAHAYYACLAVSTFDRRMTRMSLTVRNPALEPSAAPSLSPGLMASAISFAAPVCL